MTIRSAEANSHCRDGRNLALGHAQRADLALPTGR